ncbi:MAG: hypothetical protein HKM04_04110 [Legionellales bacterium]|nr:hypothetical protein [Legionellales bacterium]
MRCIRYIQIIRPHWKLACCLLSFSALGLAAPAITALTWQQKAQNVCQQLDTASKAYQQNNMQQAHFNATMAYFQNYDLNIEPAARKIFQQGHIFEIEQMFSHLNSNMVDNPTPQQIAAIKQQTDALCQAIVSDAKNMDAEQLDYPT